MWNFGSSLWEIALRTVLIYLFVLAGLRLAGKREVGQMTPFDLVLLLLLANAVQNAMTGPDTSVTGGLVAAGTLLLLNTGVTRLLWNHKKVRRWVEGTPTVLILKGKIIHENLEKEKVTLESLHQALREHGVSTTKEVGIAVLEIDGSVSVLKEDELPSTVHPHHRIRFLQRKSD
jgi:uncharacterized membrane protein YcaP (DUF421 family)